MLECAVVVQNGRVIRVVPETTVLVLDVLSSIHPVRVGASVSFEGTRSGDVADPTGRVSRFSISAFVQEQCRNLIGVSGCLRDKQE